jgi:ATP synthase F1 delta subunit
MALTGSSAKRYAEAVLQLAEESRDVAQWTNALDRITQSLSPQALRLLAAPSFPLEARRTALERVTADESPGIKSLLQTLLERERIALLPAIARAYHDLLDEREGIERAVITTAVPMDEARQRDIVDRLERFHSAYYLDASHAPPPLLVASGFTDDLFPVDEALRFANRTRKRHPRTPISLLFGDFGHQRAANKPRDRARLRRAIRRCLSSAACSSPRQLR